MFIQNLLLGLLAIILGLVCVFNGYALWRVALVFLGFILGYQLGASIVPASQWFLAIILGVVFSVIVGLLSYFLWSISIIIGGGVLGASLGTALAVAIGLSANGIIGFVFAVIGAVIGAILAAVFKDIFVLVAMAVAGATAVWYGVALILPFLTFIAQPESTIATILSVILISGLALMGILFQLRMYRARFTGEYYFEERRVA
jgi:hypothetical protein